MSNKRIFHRDSRGKFAPKPLCKEPQSEYTDDSKSQSFRLVPTKHVESVLRPLLDGNSVRLIMTSPTPRADRGKKFVVNDKVVVLVPGEYLGSRRGTCLVSIINGGCAPIGMDVKQSVSRLVLAGMPSNLAKALVKEFVRLHQE